MENSENIETHLDEPLTPEKIAETVGVRVKLVNLLVEHGLLETVDDQSFTAASHNFAVEKNATTEA